MPQISPQVKKIVPDIHRENTEQAHMLCGRGGRRISRHLRRSDECRYVAWDPDDCLNNTEDKYKFLNLEFFFLVE